MSVLQTIGLRVNSPSSDLAKLTQDSAVFKQEETELRRSIAQEIRRRLAGCVDHGQETSAAAAKSGHASVGCREQAIGSGTELGDADADHRGRSVVFGTEKAEADVSRQEKVTEREGDVVLGGVGQQRSSVRTVEFVDGIRGSHQETITGSRAAESANGTDRLQDEAACVEVESSVAGHPDDSESEEGRRKCLLASISETVQTIVSKHPNGLLCSKLPAEYQMKSGCDLALAELGFHSVLDLVSRLPLRVIKSNAFGDWLLFTLTQKLPDFVNGQTQADDGLIAAVEDGNRLQESKERIRDILLSFPDGLRMSSLEDHFQMNCNERLPYAALGFSSVETFVLHLTEDVLTVKYTPDGLMLYPIMPLQTGQSVSRDLYPVDAVGPGRSFERVKLPDVPSGVYSLEIFVAEVYHPHKFWFHLVGDEYADALEKLMDEMEMTYCTTLGFKYRMQEATVRVGQVCACPYGEQGYHRAVITGVRRAPEPVKVFYVDYGSVGTVSREFLRFLPEQFFGLPAQALLGRLANIDAPDADGWSRETSKTFLSLVNNNRVLYAMVLERSPSCVSLCLCDTNGTTDLHVNDHLVELGLAVFRNQSVDIDDKAVEELSRPVSVAPSPRSATAAATAAAAAVSMAAAAEAAVARRCLSPEELAVHRSLSPEELASAAGRDTPSDIDRLLQETLGSSTAAAASTPVSPAVPGQPPGFSSFPPLPPAASAGPTSAAFAQMLTQSALLNNLQMMQMQSLMNPMMNPAYAALFMSQAAGGGAAVSAAAPACSTVQTPVVSPVTAAMTDAASAVPPTAVSDAPPPASVASGPSTLASPEAPRPAPSGGAQPLAPSVVSSGHDAGVCIAAPIHPGSSASHQELTEEEIAQMNFELGELAIQRRFIKQISVPDGVVHLICLDGAGFLVSAEISHFLWSRDILHTMLMMKRIALPHRSVDVESHQDLFAELVRYNVPGVMDGEDLVDPLTLYPITCVPRVFNVFKNMKNEHDVKGIIEDIIGEFDAADPYWTSADEEECELAELCSEPAGGESPAPRRSSQLDVGSPRRSSLLDVGSPRPAESCAWTAPSGADSDLLPEMRAILTQLQNKRRRKVEATMMGLEGTDFSPEDVIGDDLRKMDAQIASFQRRIDALVVSVSQQPAPLGRPAAVRSTSISMNPNAPEFVHPGKESVYASADNTIYTLDDIEVVGSRPRAPVELRAPDGTPVDLSQLVSRAQTLQRRGSDAAPPPPPPPCTPPPRRPLELCTPDGQPVQLGRPVRATSSPHRSPPAVTAVSGAPGPGQLQGHQPQNQPTAAQSHHPPGPQPQNYHPAAPQMQNHQPAAPQMQSHHPAGPQMQNHHPAGPQMQSHPPASQQMQSYQAAAPQQPRYAPYPVIQPLRPPVAAPPPPPPPPPQQQQQQQQQWRMPAQQPPYGMMFQAYQQPYLAYQQLFQQAAGPFQRMPQQPLGFAPQQQMYNYQPSAPVAPAQYTGRPLQQAPPPPNAPPAHPGK